MTKPLPSSDSAARRRRGLLLGLVLGAHAGAILLLLRPVALPVPVIEAVMLVVDMPAPQPGEDPARADMAGLPDPEGEASPEAPRMEPVPVSVPEPDIRIEPPEPATLPPVPAQGQDRAAGAATADARGSGGGGVGKGAGSGASGAGTGGGGAGISRARWLSGSIERRDYPRSASQAGRGGTVIAHFDVTAEGRVRNCRVVQSSGDPALDATTCRLIEERFRYTPARNAAGEAVPDIAGWKQDWWLAPRR
ncbi:TonB family protein [Sandaracinobacteroides sp. A072]|uniref:TonB family protein n=1 Tax=Sandaracinobacteroides sp. A072 TaxID=3461146 RepID=UPI0040436339